MTADETTKETPDCSVFGPDTACGEAWPNVPCKVMEELTACKRFKLGGSNIGNAITVLARRKRCKIAQSSD